MEKYCFQQFCYMEARTMEGENGKKTEVDAHTRLVYLLVAFGLVTVLVAIGCFGCSNETAPIGEAEALLQLQNLVGTQWLYDDTSGEVEMDGIELHKIRFGSVPDADMNLDVSAYEEGNPVGLAWTMHINAHGLTITTIDGAKLTVSHSTSSGGSTENITLTDEDGRKLYFLKEST